MGSRLLCSVTLRLPGAGLVYSEVTQTPKYQIKSGKQQVTLKCSPESGHHSEYWYQQALGQGPQFLIQFYNREVNEKGNRSILRKTLMDSAVYLCASSHDTALHDQVPLGQKHPCPSSGSGAQGVSCQPAKPRLW
ncbi:hypothetical protein FD754_025336 [Muntiacus muntjak]|uniref:Ig-like domain-containing protein n=1 Tax=Muntiacus muntjak TaxID=9888 RepID=A0A5N3UKJ9_MUNMU|nr:hypothetical protein FD754_025336 [Muntiacus muntjak]